MDKYAVVGNPVAHSRSPQIHAAFAQATGQDMRYERLQAPIGGFAAAVEARFAARGSMAAVALAALAGRDFDVVVNATSAGLTSDVTLPWPPRLFRPQAFAYDMIYADAPTTFLRWASAQGVRRTAD